MQTCVETRPFLDWKVWIVCSRLCEDGVMAVVDCFDDSSVGFGTRNLTRPDDAHQAQHDNVSNGFLLYSVVLEFGL